MEKPSPLSKVTILSYSDRRMEQGEKMFVLPMNPESYSKNVRVEYDNRNGHGNQGTSGRYNNTAPEQLKLEFLLDGTNTIFGYDNAGGGGKITDRTPPRDDLVEKKLSEFLEAVYDMDGDIHRNRFCRIFMGMRVLQCVLSNLDINYSLFHPNGKPLRAKVNATFTDYIAPEQREQKARRSSPDLTRIRKLKGGDRLDKMVNEFYNDPRFVTQVAHLNGLTTFRQVKPGTEVLFPPLDKTEDSNL